MAIIIDETNRIFTLFTDNSMYQMKADHHNVLLHTWYGKRSTDYDLSYLIPYADRGFSGNPYDAGYDRTYSLDTLPQEFPSYGSGDYRTCALKVRYPDGTTACELRYKDFRLETDKYSIPGLPALYAEPSTKADTLVITLEDTRHMFYVHLYYGVLENLDMITRTAVIENHSTASLTLNRIMSTCIDFLYGDFDFHTLSGRYNKERSHQRVPLMQGISSVGSTRGTSSHQHNPFLILSDKITDEDHGNCYGFSLLYSGDFLGQVELDHIQQTRIILGIHPDNFTYHVAPGDAFYAPEVAMAYSANGLGHLSRLYHRAYRHNLCRGKFKTARRPILLNSWEGVYFDFNGEKLLKMAESAAEMGIELFVMDDGWFGKREDDFTGLGDWNVNEKKLGCTLNELSRQIHALGMQFGIWFEPEAVSEDSDLYRSHPDFALQIPGKPPTRSRFQLVLDFSREDVRRHIYTQICQILDSAKIDYLKWDFNRSLSDIYSAHLPSDCQGETAHRYVLGLYEMLELLTKRYPDLLIEGCSGGGGRFDAGMLYYTPQIWCSDDTDAIERLSIQHGTSLGYPISSMGSHISKCPNEQTGRCTPLNTRATVAMSGTFGYELDVTHMSAVEKESIRRQIQEFQKNYDLIQNGDYYRLTDPSDGNDFHSWEFVSSDGREALLCSVALTLRPNTPGNFLRPKGLQPDSTYSISDEFGRIPPMTFPGNVLMNTGILLPVPKEEYESFRIYVRKCD